jgi:hypothetical protein
MTDRIFELWAGEQQSGKTYQLRSRVERLRLKKSVWCVMVLDRLNELGDLAEPGAVAYRAFESFRSDVYSHGLPAVAVFQLGSSAGAYAPVFGTAREIGSCVLVLDEAREFMPPGAAWRGDRALREIVFAGRHLENAVGEMRSTGLIVATQYPRSVHHDVHEQAETVMCSIVRGENGRGWVRENFGAAALSRVDGLQRQEWTCLRGRDPRRG